MKGLVWGAPSHAGGPAAPVGLRQNGRTQERPSRRRPQGHQPPVWAIRSGKGEPSLYLCPERCNVPILAMLGPTTTSGRSTDHDKIAPTTIRSLPHSQNPMLDMHCHGTARPDRPFGQYSMQHGAWHVHGPTDLVRNVAQVSLMFFQYIYTRMSIV